jgi:hypothetical protein
MTKFPELQRIVINPQKDDMVNEAILVKIKSAQNKFSTPVLFRFMAFVSKYDFHSMDLLYTTLNVDQLINNYWRLCDPKEPKVVVLTYTKKNRMGIS